MACVPQLFMLGEAQGLTVSTWFLRKPEGEIFGPVEQDELLRWAGTDRIGPEDAVSSDRKDWLPAPQMPGLKLWWMIEWPDGHKAGSYHVSSLAEMLAEGELDGNEMVRQVHTQQAASLLQTLQKALLAGELQLGQGSLTAALCGVIRGPTMPVPATQPATAVEPPPQPVVKKPVKHPAVGVRPAPVEQPTVAAVPAAALAVAQRMHVQISEGAEALEEVLQHLPTLLRELKTRETALAEAEKRAQGLQTELAESRGQFATHQRMREDERAAVRAQIEQREAALRQGREQMAALKTEWAVITKQRTALAAELRVALERVAERERNAAQLRDELKAAQAIKESGEQARRELESVRQKLGESETVAQRYEQNLAKLRLQLADREEARLQARTQAERKAEEYQEATAALEAARDAALTQRMALQAERDAAVARADERGELCEQLAADKRRKEGQLRTELQQTQAANTAMQQEKAELLKQLNEARQRMLTLEQSARQQTQAQEELRQQLATGQTAQIQELAQLNAALAEQRAAFGAEQKQWADTLRSVRRELETWRQRALATPAPTLQPAPVPSQPAPVEPMVLPSAGKPMRPAPSVDLYCLPPRKVWDNS